MTEKQKPDPLETPRERQIRQAFKVADELAKKTNEHYERVFTHVFDALTSGTLANPTPDGSDVAEAIAALSKNVGKYLALIAGDQRDQETVDKTELSLKEINKALADSLKTAT